MFSPTRLSRQLRRLDIGMIKNVAGTYRYYLTKAGRAANRRRGTTDRGNYHSGYDLMGFFDAKTCQERGDKRLTPALRLRWFAIVRVGISAVGKWWRLTISPC
jgi:hypothetical protein